MLRAVFFYLAAWALVPGSVRAIENIVTSTYNESDPTNASVSNWTTGWTQPAIQPAGYTYTTGWNYVGRVNGASGTYLGNGWVMTAAHVGAGQLTLNGVGFSLVPNSTVTFGSLDLIIFQVSPAPPLPSLILRVIDAVPYSTNAVIVGFGDGGSLSNETWGQNIITQIDESVTPDGTGYVSNDFLTITGSSGNGFVTATNKYQVVVGDSGGGAFVYNTSTKLWELAGLNEVTGTVTYENGTMQNFSGFVQLDTYAGQINAIVSASADIPTLPFWATIVLAGLLAMVGGFISVYPGSKLPN